MKKIYNAFYDVLKYSNYKVISCYKLAFSADNFNYNKGFWIIFILFLLYLAQFTIYLRKRINPLKINIARYHFRKNIVDKNKSENKNDIYDNNYNQRGINEITEKNNISSNSQFPPKKGVWLQKLKINMKEKILIRIY